MITKEDLELVKIYSDLIKHAVGADHKKEPGFRNRFCASVNSPDYHRLQEMVKLGLAREGYLMNQDQDQLFFITREGCEFAGLPKATIDRAMDQ